MNATGITSTASARKTLEADMKPSEAANEPYHTLGVNLKGIAWLTGFHGDALLDVIKQRRVRELEGMNPVDPVTAKQLESHKNALHQLTNDDAIGHDWLFVMQRVGKKHGATHLSRSFVTRTVAKE
jgi:hypothetical protein